MALDIDGTLTAVASNHIAPAVKAAITRATEHGAVVVLCTGRSLVGIRAVVPQLPASYALCSNGAVWWDPALGEVTKRVTFDPGPTIKTLRALLPGSVFAVEQLGVGNLSLGEFLPGDLWGETTWVTFEEMAVPTSRLVMRWLDHTPAELAFAVRELELPGIEWSVDHTEAWLTAVPPDVSKGSALDELVAQLGISASDALAIGDGSNDVEMLKWAGLGVAMGQAPAHVQAVADEVAPTVLEDGAAQVLNRFFPG
ncbi:HAD superfamily hydrolase (TIGR01484 family) [Lentzea flaviverrucosa]|uniref:HAD-superfamily hydrolase, subfamily IIB n=1 Tax=Lentzea flaviverrucosa TaxID=200379 RepID=A0A1H9Q7S1_9PSEU|nr:HAD superfamily hydrolase (TIGR01484 family) [Lentzea flaviverrucosa]SER55939.1 HAD-superfamily hydrolase, subfamily IIB [Lentzea flaviverrucosa]